MINKTYKCAFLMFFGLILVSSVGVCSGTSELKLLLSATSKGSVSKDNPNLQVKFINLSRKPVRLLNVFEPIPIFFSFSLVNSDGIHIPISSGGKMSFGIEPKEYIYLSEGEFHIVNLDFYNIIPKNYVLPAGEYSLNVTYRTQYGEDNFKGKVSSNDLQLKIQ